MTIKEGSPILASNERAPTPLVQWRSGIIKSVLEFGILPSSQLMRVRNQHLASGDKRELSKVYGRYFEPTPKNSSRHTVYSIPREYLDMALYSGDDSILPVLFERPSDGVLEMEGLLDDPQNRRLFRKRTTSSFLVVVRLAYGLVKESYKHQFAYAIPSVPASWIDYLVFPQPVLEDVGEVSTNGLSIPIKVANRRIRREVGLWKMNVVDYETPLNEIANELEGEPIWVHGVRLPTEGDLSGVAS